MLVEVEAPARVTIEVERSVWSASTAVMSKPVHEGSLADKRIHQDFKAALNCAQFCRENASSNLMPRTETNIMERMAHNNWYQAKVYDSFGQPFHDSQSTNIVSCSTVIDFEVPCTRQGQLKCASYIEFGAMISRIPGFSMQELMIAIRLLQNLLTGERGEIFTAVYSNNEISIHSITNKCFWIEAELTPEFRVLRQHHLERIHQGYRSFKIFRPTIQSVNAASDLICSLVKNPVIARRLGLYDRFKNTHHAEIIFGNGFRPEFFSLAEMISKVRPIDERNLGDLLFNDEKYYDDGLLVV